MDECLSKLEFPPLVVFAAQSEFVIRQFGSRFFPELEQPSHEQRTFEWFLDKVHFWQVSRVVRVVTEEEKDQETAQSVGFFFDLLTDVFQTVEDKFGAPVGHLLLPVFDQDIIAKWGNISKDNRPLKQRFSERLLEFLDRVLAKAPKELRDEYSTLIFRNMHGGKQDGKPAGNV